MHRTLTAAALAVALMLMTGCAQGASVEAGYQPRDQQQSGTCDGVPKPKSVSLISPSMHVVAAVTCRTVDKYVAGQGIWSFSKVLPLPTAKIGELIGGLTEPDLASDPNGACTAMLMLVPDFVLTLSDGSRIRPGVPGDGCHPRTDALKAFGDPASITPAAQTRISQVLTELEATSNCGPEAKSPAIWASVSRAVTGHVVLPSTGAVSICRYHGTGDQQGMLSAVGISQVTQLRPLWPTVATTAPPDCAPTTDVDQTPTMDWLILLTTPKPPYTADDTGGSPIALVELAGCRRLVDPQKGVAGYVSAATADRLASLATNPVG